MTVMVTSRQKQAATPSITIDGGHLTVLELETWTLKIENERNLLAFETRCLRRIARITYTEHATNEEVRRRPKSSETILNKIKRQQLRWLGHVKRVDHDRPPKISLEGTIDGSRPRGRPSKRCIENFDRKRIVELTRTVHDRTTYRALFHDLSKEVTPKRPARMDGT
ncbi:uncharacterized protein LOC136033353 [Artemia franciscana]|uniref:uncharacterized protein LOC136033353 n=1 Tax=Artemia franciscana TaxID=6661 RepID=UPI0032DAF8BB